MSALHSSKKRQIYFPYMIWMSQGTFDENRLAGPWETQGLPCVLCLDRRYCQCWFLITRPNLGPIFFPPAFTINIKKCRVFNACSTSLLKYVRRKLSLRCALKKALCSQHSSSLACLMQGKQTLRCTLRSVSTQRRSSSAFNILEMRRQMWHSISETLESCWLGVWQWIWTWQSDFKLREHHCLSNPTALMEWVTILIFHEELSAGMATKTTFRRSGITRYSTNWD